MKSSEFFREVTHSMPNSERSKWCWKLGESSIDGIYHHARDLSFLFYSLLSVNVKNFWTYSSKNSITNTHTFLIQIHQLLPVCIFASFLSLLSLSLSLSLSVSLSIHTHTSFQLFLFTLNCFLFSAESFKSFLPTSWLFTHKNFSTSRNKGLLLQSHSAMITSGKLTQIQH